MKRTFILAVIVVMVLVCSMQVDAALQNLGTDSLGNRLIYDTDFDITWYDYTNSNNTWANQVAWASGLSVTFGSNTYTDWRLPTTVDGPVVYGFDGTTSAGYNITSSEMGHLFYAELGNKGYYATDGTNPQPGWGLTDTGVFQHLLPLGYWSGTDYSADTSKAWLFYAYTGEQSPPPKGIGGIGLAVRSGLAVAVVPEPVSAILFVVGGASLGIRWLWKISNLHISNGGTAL